MYTYNLVMKWVSRIINPSRGNNLDRLIIYTVASI